MGYETKEAAGDGWVAEVRKKFGVPEMASMEDIEPIAKKLLTDPITKLTAAELVLNRRVDGKEMDIWKIVSLDPETAFALLLMEKAMQ